MMNSGFHTPLHQRDSCNANNDMFLIPTPEFCKFIKSRVNTITTRKPPKYRVILDARIIDMP